MFTLKESFALHLLSLHHSDLPIICLFFFFNPLNKSGLGFCVLFYFGNGEVYLTNLGFTLCFIYFCTFISLFFSSLSSVHDVFLLDTIKTTNLDTKQDLICGILGHFESNSL